MNGNACQVQPKQLDNLFSYSGGGLQWFAVVCGGLPALSLVTLPIVPNSGGDLWWFAVMCDGVWWFAVVCGGLRWFAMVCGGLSFSHTRPIGLHFGIWCCGFPNNMYTKFY